MKRFTRAELVAQYKAAKSEGDESEVIRLARLLGICPECGVKLRTQEGCAVCLDCGWSQCN